MMDSQVIPDVLSDAQNLVAQEDIPVLKIEELIENPLILSNIAKYLCLDVLKNCRLVSKAFNGQIASSREFLSSARLILSNKSLQHYLTDESLDLLNTDLQKTKWRNLKIIYYNWSGILNFNTFHHFIPIFENCLDLKLNYDHNNCKSKDQNSKVPYLCGNKMQFYPFIASFKSLKRLCISPLYQLAIETLQVESVEDEERIKEILSNLDEFEIEKVHNNLPIYLDTSDKMRQNQPILSILFKMKDMKLTSFKIPHYTSCSSDLIRNQCFGSHPRKNLFEDGFYTFAFQSRNTIVELDLNLEHFSKTDLLNCSFPMLKVLKVCGKERAAEFALSQLTPQLNSLALGITPQIPRNLIEKIMETCAVNLQRLSIKTFYIPTKMKFLGSLKNLIHLDIYIRSSNNQSLGPNQTSSQNSASNMQLIYYLQKPLETLTLRGMSLFGMPRFTRMDKMGNLVELSLLRCSHSLDDEKFVFICENFTKLKKLEFSHCEGVSDFGITGLRTGQLIPTHSLKNLKGLKVLKIVSCRNISDFSCKFGIEFLELTDLDLSGSFYQESKITNEGVQFLLLNNPSLKNLTLPVKLRDGNVNEVLDPILLDIANSRNISICYILNNWPELDEHQRLELRESRRPRRQLAVKR